MPQSAYGDQMTTFHASILSFPGIIRLGSKWLYPWRYLAHSPEKDRSFCRTLPSADIAFFPFSLVSYHPQPSYSSYISYV